MAQIIGVAVRHIILLQLLNWLLRKIGLPAVPAFAVACFADLGVNVFLAMQTGYPVWLEVVAGIGVIAVSALGIWRQSQK